MESLEWPFGGPKKTGVYAIVNLLDGKQYVGSSKDLRRRWRDHLNELRSNKHPNHHLQCAFHKYGADAFDFRILQEIANEDELVSVEQHWMNVTRCYEREHGYNIDPAADRSVVSPETAAKISERIRGCVRSEETRAKIRAANNSVHPSTIWNIIKGKTWSLISDEQCG